MDHSLHEKEYVESCAESKLIQVIEPGVLESESFSSESDSGHYGY